MRQVQPVKIKEKFQVTIPMAVRDQVHLDVGDLLEATVSDEGILLKPKAVTDRKTVVNELRKALSGSLKNEPCAGKSDDEIMQEAVKIIKQVRRKDKKKAK